MPEPDYYFFATAEIILLVSGNDPSCTRFFHRKPETRIKESLPEMGKPFNFQITVMSVCPRQ